MKKTLLVVFAMMLLGAATANAQNAGNHKATIEKGKSAAKGHRGRSTRQQELQRCVRKESGDFSRQSGKRETGESKG